ncbi:gamma-glutamyltransferase [Miltoncostaea marina]|uniref:gamma-glutamyltransferase n=1 Tax=Miltoncostaea marina TaxID=2843215 RepID=UPI001C3C35C6|nr:gamma-glutamyltransferase [Miltoncostaea marina]
MGVVAAGHRLTARAGAEILARGGGAVDAVCAAALAGAVAESPLTGPGAGGFLIARDPGGRTTLLDFFVAVPGLGPAGRRLDPGDLRSFTVPFGGADQEFHIGPASVGVPGLVAGVGEAVARLGRLPLAEIVAPAVRIAGEGVVLTREAAYLHAILGEMLTATPEAAAVYAPGGRLLGAGDRVRFPDLAGTLRHIGAAGPATFRDGVLAAALADHMAAAGGLVTREDLLRYEVVERMPLRVAYRGAELLTNPPPSSGGALIAAALHEMEAGPPPADEVGHYRAVARAGAAANALRDEAFPDDLWEEDFMERLWARRAAAGRGGASPGPPEGRKPAGSTTHVSAVDADGGMAGLSSSNGSGSGVVVPGTGVLLNNMLGEEDLNPGGFGRIAPGRRMTSMMAPSLLLRDGEPVLVIGSAGSNRLRSAILQTLVAIVDGGMGAADAVRRPRVHPEGRGVDVEGGVPGAAADALAADGHELRRWGEMNLFFGGVSVAARGPGGPEGAGDPRRGGAAAAVTRSGEVIDI